MPESSPGGLAPGFVSRLERFERVSSTQAIVRDWLDEGMAEVCVAVSDVQSSGRGRLDRSWDDRPGGSLLVSAGFRPPALPASLGWRLPAVASLAMLRAMRALLGPTSDRLALKWPNDLVAVHAGHVRKLGGVLAESTTEGQHTVTAVVGLGVNVDWAAADFPPALAASMWSLREVAGGRRVDRDALLAAWLVRLGPLYEALGHGHFDGRAWAEAQVTTGASVVVESGGDVISGTAVGVDQYSGALLVRAPSGEAVQALSTADVVRCRLDEAPSDL